MSIKNALEKSTIYYCFINASKLQCYKINHHGILNGLYKYIFSKRQNKII